MKLSQFHISRLIIMKDVLVNCLNNPFYATRLEASKFLPVILSSEEVDYAWKLELMSDIFKAIDLLCANEEAGPDESKTNIISAIHILVACLNKHNYCLNEALFKLLKFQVNKMKISRFSWYVITPLNFRFQAEKKVKTCLIKNALSASSTECLRFIKTHLKYVLYQWLIVEELPIKDFPHSLLDYPTELTFLKDQANVIFPLILQHKDSKIQEFCTYANYDFTACANDNFCEIFPWLLADNATNNLASKILKTLLKKDSCSTLFSSKLDGILVELAGTLHDSNLHTRIFGTMVYRASEAKVKLDTVAWTTLFLSLGKDYMKIDQTLTEFLITQRPDALQKVK